MARLPVKISVFILTLMFMSQSVRAEMIMQYKSLSAHTNDPRPCGEQIDLTVTGPDSSFFEGDKSDLIRLFRSSQVYLSSVCPAIQSIKVLGLADDAPAYEGVARAEAGWELVDSSPQGGAPNKEEKVRNNAEGGNPEAQFILGKMYLEGNKIEKNQKEGIKWIRSAAERGYADAQYFMGTIYYRGDYVTSDLNIAKRWLDRAAMQGNESAGKLLKEIRNISARQVAVPGSNKTNMSVQKAPYEHQDAAREKYELGLTLEEKAKKHENLQKVMKNFRQAAEMGHTGAQYRLGLMYQEGKGVPRDYREALKWYLKAGRNGNADAEKAIEKLELIARTAPKIEGNDKIDQALKEKAARFAIWYANTRYITSKEILSEIPSVSLHVDPASAFDSAGREDIESTVSRAVQKQGIKIDSKSGYRLGVKVRNRRHYLSRNTAIGDQENYVYLVIFSVDLHVWTNVLRNDHFVKLPVGLMQTFVMYEGLEELTGGILLGKIDDMIGISFADFRQRNYPPGVAHEDQWLDSLWPASQDHGMIKSWASVLRDTVKTSNLFEGIRKVKPVDVNFIWDGDAVKYFSAAQLENRWKNSLQEANILVDPKSDIEITHKLNSTVKEGNRLAKAVGWWTLMADPYRDSVSFVQISQDNIVFMLNDRLVRTKGVLYFDMDMDSFFVDDPEAKDFPVLIFGHIDQTIKNIVKWR